MNIHEHWQTDNVTPNVISDYSQDLHGHLSQW